MKTKKKSKVRKMTKAAKIDAVANAEIKVAVDDALEFMKQLLREYEQRKRAAESWRRRELRKLRKAA